MGLMYLLGGLGLAMLALWGLNRFKTANVTALAKTVSQVAGWSAIGLAAFFAVRGMIGYAFSLVMTGAWLLGWTSGFKLPGKSGPAVGRTSKVVTDHLEMELEHDTGAMRGRVIKGVFAGRSIERLAPAELAMLWRDCRFTDPKSAQLIEAWLDRTHPTWREDMARAEAEPGAGGIMTPDEALEILGLKAGAGEEDIRRAHRELMKRFHPDAGGSGYLASKINEAKDVLLRG